MHGPFMAMSAVKALQLTHAYPKQKTPHVWDLRFSLAVNPSLLAHLALIASMCVVLKKESGIKRDGEGERSDEGKFCRFGESATSHCLPCGHNQQPSLCL